MSKQFLIDLYNQYDEKIKVHKTIYMVGKSGFKKSSNILQFLKTQDYDHTYTSLQQIRNSNEIYDLLKSRNICSMFSGKNKYRKKVLVIDNIDYLQNVEKKNLGNIIKLIKSKEFQEKMSNYCIIFIGNNLYDKKQIELSLCVEHYIYLNDIYTINHETYKIQAMKKNVLDLLNNNYDKGINLNNEKTIISLCYHENIIKVIKNFDIYERFLQNLCNGDFYDRISFQKQLWQFNEMTYYLKVLHNYNIIHSYYIKNDIDPKIILKNHKIEDICFTKVLTKYSNEYSNNNFIINKATNRNLSKYELYTLICNKNYDGTNFSNQEIKRLCKLFRLDN